MPNDNTHTQRELTIQEVFRVANEIRAEGVSDTLHLEEMENRLFDISRTPAEPKAGDWGRLTDADPITSPSTDPRLSSAPSRAGDWEKGIDWEKENAPQSVWDALESGGIKDVVQAVGDWAYNTALSRQSVNDNGDWEKELDQLHDALGLLKLGDHPDKVFGEYVFPLFRALSSAAPRITENQDDK